MPLKPLKRDDNGVPLHGHGSEIVTKRFTSVGSAGQSLTLPIDVKSFVIHYEGITEVGRYTGSSDDSDQIRLTSDGLSLSDMDVSVPAGESLGEIAAPAGTVNVSVIGWR